jgi:hypothetical protein
MNTNQTPALAFGYYGYHAHQGTKRHIWPHFIPFGEPLTRFGVCLVLLVWRLKFSYSAKV